MKINYVSAVSGLVLLSSLFGLASLIAADYLDLLSPEIYNTALYVTAGAAIASTLVSLFSRK